MSKTEQNTFDATLDLGGPPPPPGPPRLVAGRYQALAPIGRGGFGFVWRAHDTVRDVDVALKLITVSQPQQRDQVRREITALRWLHLPGIARLRDEGVDGGRWFIVMDLAPGEHFPGAEPRAEWPQLEPLAVSLLEILSRLHAAGIVHRDLKPANVLVDEGGRVTLVDFGIAAGPAGLAIRGQRFVGTPRYASPEQCDGQPTDGRSDLFSLGAMLHEALTGEVPHEAVSRSILMRRRRREQAASIQELRPDLPADVAEFVDALLRRRPGDRPASAVEALGMLERRSRRPRPAPLLAGVERVGSWQGLRRLFHGPDRFLHLQTDAARELWRRTGGHADRVSRELHAWERAGLGHREGRRLRVERPALERLQTGVRIDATPIPPATDGPEQQLVDHVRLAFPGARPGWVRRAVGLPDRVFDETAARLLERGLLWRVGERWFAGAELEPVPHWPADARGAALRSLSRELPDEELAAFVPLAMADNDDGFILERARDVAHRLVEQADHSRAAALIRLALAHAEVTDPSAVEPLLILRACVAQAEGTIASCNEALYLLDRMRSGPDALRDVDRLVRATRAQLQGEVERAESWIREPLVTDHALLELAWNRMRAQVARLRGNDEVERVLAELEGWSRRSRQNRAAWLGWLGVLRYLQGRYEQAADLCARAASGRGSASARLANEIDAAGALLECGRVDEAAVLAERATRRARELRRHREEAVATFITRTARYRAGQPLRPQLRLAESAGAVSEYTGALIGLTEAAFALRTGKLQLAASLASRSAQSHAQVGHHTGEALALALACAAGADVDPAPLVAEARKGAHPDLDVQILGLLRMAGADVDPDAVARVAERVPRGRWGHRLDVLSVDECVGHGDPALL